MRHIAFVVGLIATVVFASAFADPLESVEKRLKEMYPATRITAVRSSPVNGLYEVIMGRNVAYSDESGRYMFFGHVYDMKEQKDITAQVLEEINRIDISVLPLDDAIRTVKGKGERKIYVFSDPDCPFCKKLERELVNIDNVTVYTFLFPLSGLHPDAPSKAKAIWCAKDRSSAWKDFMLDGKLPEVHGQCDNPVDRNIRLAASLNFSGTPTIVFADGTVVSGVIPSEEIEKRLALSSNQSRASVSVKNGK